MERVRRPSILGAGAVALVALIVCSLFAFQTHSNAGPAAASAQAALPLCKGLNGPNDLPKGRTTNLAVVEQGYRCILRHYVTGNKLDDRTLLQAAYSALSGQLGNSIAGISLPSLSGDRNADWQAFAQTYNNIYSRLLALVSAQQISLSSTTLQESMAQVSLDAMARSLHDDHTSYLPADFLKPELAQLTDNTPSPTLGLVTSPLEGTVTTLFITDVFPNTPAATAGLKPGDVIQQINGKAAVSNGRPGAGVLPLLLPQLGSPVTISVQRPVDGSHFTVTMHPQSLISPATTARVLAGNIAYVKLFSFTSDAYKRVVNAIDGLGLGSSLRGVVLDLRGNGGGDEDQAVRIASAFVHNKIVGYEVDGAGHRTPQRTNNRIPLLHQPLVVLTDADSASSSELVASVVRDYHLGFIVGGRTAGAIAGAEFFGLGDGSGFEITEVRVLGPLGEKVDGIGIAPSQQIATSAAELSAGHDAVVDQAVKDVRQATPGA